VATFNFLKSTQIFNLPFFLALWLSLEEKHKLSIKLCDYKLVIPHIYNLKNIRCISEVASNISLQMMTSLLMSSQSMDETYGQQIWFHSLTICM
jgi:hypothetical protein